MIKERSTLTKEEIKEIEEIIGYEFKNKGLLIQAFTRRSYGNEHKVPDNEMLEFFGDAALSYAVTREIYKSCYVKKVDNISEDDYPNRLDIDISGKREWYVYPERFKLGKTPEENLSKEKEMLVERKHLSGCMNKSGLAQYLIMNKADLDNKVYENDAIKEDLLEAILGAVAVDSDWNFDSIYSCVVDLVLSGTVIAYSEKKEYGEVLFLEPIDFVSSVQEWFQTTIGKLPNYTYKIEDNVFRCTLSVTEKSLDFSMTAPGRSKKEAKGLCADCFFTQFIVPREDIVNYDFITKDFDYSIFEKLTYDNAVNFLQELEQKKLIPSLTYEYDNLFDSNGNPVWRCTVKFKSSDGEHTRYVEPYVDSKKKAKKNTAYSLACNIALCVVIKTGGRYQFSGFFIDFSENEYIYSKQNKDEFIVEKELVDGKQAEYICSFSKPLDDAKKGGQNN